MKQTASLLALLVISVCPDFARADGTPKRSPGLQVLDRFVGTWDMQAITETAEGKKTVHKYVSRRTWSIGGKFLRTEEPNLNNPELTEYHLLFTYDSKARNYPGVFMSGLTRSFMTGTWDEDTQTMTYEATFPGGYRYTGTLRFVDQDHAEGSGVTTASAGHIVSRVSLTQTRRRSPTSHPGRNLKGNQSDQ